MAKQNADDVPTNNGAHDPSSANTSSGDTSPSDGSGSSDPQQYQGSTTLLPGHGRLEVLEPFHAPPVPNGSGGGTGTQVDTPSLALFATNVAALLPHVEIASLVLKAVDIAPGAFYHANKMRTGINGVNADGGLKAQYTKVLADLHQGLTDIHDGVSQLAQHYATVDDAARMSAGDLHSAMQTASADFTGLITDAGGSGTSGTGGT